MQNNTEYSFTSDLDIVFDPNSGSYLYQSTLTNSMNKFFVEAYQVINGGNLRGEQKIPIAPENISYDRVSGNISMKMPDFDYDKQFMVITTLAENLNLSPVICYNTVQARGKKLTNLQEGY